MNRKLTSLIFTSIALSLFASYATLVDAQSTDATGTTKDPAAVTKDPTADTKDPTLVTKDPAADTKDPTSITTDANGVTTDASGNVIDPYATPDPKNPSGDSGGYSGSFGITSKSTGKSHVYYGNDYSCFSGPGSPLPPAYAYGQYCSYGDGSGCGVAGWYQQNFGGITRGYRSCACGSLGCGPYGCGGYSPCLPGGGYGLLGHGGYGCRRSCGYRSGYGSCCPGVAAPIAPACCTPRPNCCGAVTSVAVMARPMTAVATPTPTPAAAPVPTTTAPAVKNATPAPAPTATTTDLAPDPTRTKPSN